MLNENLKLNPDLFKEDLGASQGFDKTPTRNGFGDALLKLGEENENVVALTADLSESVRTEKFAEKFPERFFEVGIAEQNLVSVASGLAHQGKIPFAASYAMFSPGRSWEQIRTTVCYNNQPVKMVGSHSGLLTGPDGGTHQALEDIAITRVLPNMVVVSPCDYQQAYKATVTMSETSDPTYLRLSREKTPQITTTETPFEIGKAQILFQAKEQGGDQDGDQEKVGGKIDVGIISTGVVTYQALKTAQKLEDEGLSVEVINIHTIKPLDEEAIIKLAEKAGAIVTVEEHQINGGLGGAVAEVLSRNHPTPQEFVGVKDLYGESGNGYELFSHFEIDEKAIEEAVKKVINRK
ncbi:transketolase family protein [Candidatus Parcubacteria bacterium]|nr:transketolase family protein [Candidatus Parcubacteria bacterium]